MRLNNETKIGILVTAVLGILFVLTWKAGNFDFSTSSYRIKVRFKNIEGIEPNAPVTLNGFEIGRVKDIDILYGDVPTVEVSLLVRGDVKVPRGVQAMVKNMGFMGEKYVGLFAADATAGFLAPEEMIQGQEPSSFEALLSDGQEIATNIKEISQQINARLKVNSEHIDQIFADTRVTMSRMASISQNVDERLAANKTLIDEAIFHVNSATRNFDEMSYDLKLNPWKLMYRTRTRVEKPSEGGVSGASR